MTYQPSNPVTPLDQARLRITEASIQTVICENCGTSNVVGIGLTYCSICGYELKGIGETDSTPAPRAIYEGDAY